MLTFLRQKTMSMLLCERSCLLLLSQSALNQLLWESISYKFYQYLKQFASALFFDQILADRTLSLQHSKERAAYCSFSRALSNSNFGKVLLISFIITWNNLLQHCISSKFLLVESYGQSTQSTLRKELLIAPFVQHFKTTTSRKSH